MKHLFRFSLLLLALLLPANALAHDFEVDGIYYNINGTEATVTSCPYPNKYTGDVAIPASVTYGGTTYSVTSIGDCAFYECSGLTGIDIPNSVTSIGSDAFSSCSNLAIIQVASGNPTYDSRDNCNAIVETSSNTLITGCMNTIIPNSVTSIGDYAFLGCSNLTSVNIPNSVTSIGLSAFFGCSSLTSVYITDLTTWCNIDFLMGWGFPFFEDYDGYSTSNPLHYAHHLFLNGVEVKDLVIPNTVTNIKDGAFVFAGLTSVTIPNSVTSIGVGAFYGSSLTSVTIPNSVTTINWYAFYGSGLTNVTIPNSVTTIGENAFCRCSSLEYVNIGNSVTSIGYGTFSWCDHLINITVASGNPRYDSRNNCNAIIETANNTLVLGCMSTIIPNSVIAIGCGAFAGQVLGSITIPNSIRTISSDAFGFCQLFKINCLASVPPTIDSNTFSDYYGVSLSVPDNLLDDYKSADYWKEFVNIDCITFEVDSVYYRVIDTNTTSVMANSDEGLFYSGDVVVPDSVTYEGYTFAVTGIESNVFDGCYELTSVVIPNSVETIGEQAFQGCTGLTSVTIGSGVTSIGSKAFNYCNALETVKCLGTVPPVMASADCFSTAAYNRATLLVPRNYEQTYAAADYWYKFAHIEGWGSAGRGDVNGDGIMNIADVTFLIDAILRGDHEGVYFESADLNINGRLDIGDVTTIIDMLLNGE